MTAVPLVNEKVEAGQIVDPEWKTQQSATIAVGQPGRLMLLKPAGEPGKYPGRASAEVTAPAR